MTERCERCGMQKESAIHMTNHTHPEIRGASHEFIPESDAWMERSRKFQENGGCPCCFCSDEGPHENGCYIAELCARIKGLEKAIEWAIQYLERDVFNVDEVNALIEWMIAELRRRAKEG